MADLTAALAAAQKTRIAECARCGGLRNCDVRAAHSEDVSADDFWTSTKWRVLSCRGCDYVFVQTVSTNSEAYGYEQDDDGPDKVVMDETVRYWPALSKRKKPYWMDEYGVKEGSDDELSGALVELYRALDNDMPMLAAIGVRTAFDIASEHLGVDPEQKFKEKLDVLVSTGEFKPEDRDRFEALVDAGSASAHRGWRPAPAHLNTMMNVLEHFIEEAFISPDLKRRLDDEAAKLKKLVPPRPKRDKKAKPSEPAE